jgi:hypothetical protein
MDIQKILNLEIAFDGWGISIILFVLSAFGVGAYVYKTKNKIRQQQKAGNNSKQSQIVHSKSLKDKNDISQKQKAGNNANQNQSV